jgi:tRNA (adenine57-N1/adenine58-N1)-methyltransferase
MPTSAAEGAQVACAPVRPQDGGYGPHLTKVDDLVLLVTGGGKRHLLRLKAGRQFHSHLGQIKHDDLLNLPYGTTVYSHLGHALLLLEPSLDDRITRIKRNTQIIYPKDAAMIVQRLNLRAGSRVIEAGTGSGGLAIALAWSVAPSGRVYSYELRDEHVRVARSNLEKMGLLPYVELHNASILEGFQQTDADALVLDVRTPWLFLEQVRAALRPGAFFAALVPTTNQVSALLHGLERSGFADIGVEEILVRKYKPVPDRLRPDDSMVGHTGFIISARPVIDEAEPGRWLSEERKRYEARKVMEKRIAEEKTRRASQETDRDRIHPRLP